MFEMTFILNNAALSIKGLFALVQTFATGPIHWTAGVLMFKRDIKHWCNSWTMGATIITVFLVSESLLLSTQAWSKGLYTLFRWRRSKIACGGSEATRLSWIISNCFTCRSFDSMLWVIIEAVNWHQMSVYSGYHNCVVGIVHACV